MEITSENLTNLIFEIINLLVSKIFNSIDKTICSILDSITFIDKSMIQNPHFTRIFGDSSEPGLILICNSLALGIFIYYGIKLLLSHLTMSKIQSPVQFFFKSLIFLAFMNASFWICSEIIDIISIITKTINILCVDLFNKEISFQIFIENLNHLFYKKDATYNLFSFDGIVKSFSSIGMINLIFTYSLRYIMIQLFVLLSPFAFISLILEGTEHFFKSWFRNFISLLLIQILLSFILLLSHTFEYLSDPTIIKLLYIATIYAINRANIFMKELLGGISFNINNAINSFKSN